MRSPYDVLLSANHKRTRIPWWQSAMKTHEFVSTGLHEFFEGWNKPICGRRHLTQRIDGHSTVRCKKFSALPMLHVLYVRESRVPQFFCKFVVHTVSSAFFLYEDTGHLAAL